MTPEEFSKAPLSAVIRVALEDLARVEIDPRYKVDMGVWHDQIVPGRCYVCLAGAVMAGTMGVQPWQDIDSPIEAVAIWIGGDVGAMAKSIHARMWALNRVRTGDIGVALARIGADRPVGVEWPAVTPYDDDPAAFRRDLLKVAAALEERGL